MGENTVHAKGETDDSGALTLYVCTWTTTDRTYSVTSTSGVAQAEMTALLEAIH